jgi:MoaA/NifB/PqqE/SkfB family radical SAM enzyme
MRLMRRKKLAMSQEETARRYITPLRPNLHRYLTPHKLRNAVLSELDMRKRVRVARGLPYVLHLEPTNACTLRCPLCITGARDNQLPTGKLSFDQFSRLMSRLKDDIVFMRLDGSGEPFINRDFIPMVEYAHAMNVGTVVSTNFQNTDPADAERLVRAGLDYVIVSLDGVTQEVYETYRVGGDIRKVYDNLEALLAARKQLGRRNPYIEWQFLEFDHNAHETPLAQQQAAEMGVDRILVSNARPSAWQANIADDAQSTCYWFYKSINVAHNGDLKACCSDGLGEDFSMGNLLEQSLPEIWNGPVMQDLRDLFISPQRYTERVAASKCITHCPMVNAGRGKHGLPEFEHVVSDAPIFEDDWLTRGAVNRPSPDDR